MSPTDELIPILKKLRMSGVLQSLVLPSAVDAVRMTRFAQAV